MDWAIDAVKVLSATLLAAVLWWLLGAGAKRHSSQTSAQARWYTFKYWLAYAFVAMRKRRSPRGGGGTGAVPGLGATPSSLCDAARPLLACRDALDSAYFCGFDSNGNWLVARIGRRHDRQAEIWLTLHMAGDGTYESPVHPDTIIVDGEEDSFSAGNLILEVLEEFRRWRISFNGPLRKISRERTNQTEASDNDLSHVRFTFIWEALSGLYCSDNDISSSLMAAALANEQWNSKYFERLRDLHQTRYEQAGGFLGSVSVEGSQPTRLTLRGFRDRSFGVRNWSSFRRYISHFLVLEDGTFIVLSVVDFPGCFSRIASGCIFMPNSEKLEISWTSLHLNEVGECGKPPAKYLFDFTAGGMPFKVRISVREETIYYHGSERASKCHEQFVEVTSNSCRGFGISEFFYRNEEPSPNLHTSGRQIIRIPSEPPQIASPVTADYENAGKYVVSFDQDLCRNSNFVGGKASQLGILTKLQKQEGFIVPYGICLTIHAFNSQVSEDAELRRKIEELELTASGQRSNKDLAAACNAATDHIKSSSLKRDVQLAIAEEMIRAFKPDVGTKLFAVRSSAVGEDGSELSSAGQMETLLGVRGDPQHIATAVLSCWASHYAYQAVEYKRQYGQSISSGMGVVIQEMVQSECSGVLFTRDAVTGNPTLMTINANFGLGESVVSGQSEPDTIRISRSPTGSLKIIEKCVGNKAFQIQVKGGGGTEAVSMPTASGACCLKDEITLRLCSIGLRLEYIMGGARDVEWALFKNEIYLLQARPVTTSDQAEEYEIMREFDTPHSTDGELCTSANIGEMMPSAMTPLTITTFYRSIETAMQRYNSNCNSFTRTPDAHVFCKISRGHGFLNIHAMEMANESHNFLNQRRVMELSLLGQTLQSMTDSEVNSYNKPLTYMQRIVNTAKMIHTLWTAEEPVKYWEKQLETYTISSSTTAEEIYRGIEQKLPDLTEVWFRGIVVSALSAVAAQTLISVLTKGKTNYTKEHYQDIAQLLACCDDVVSATVPVMLKEIADIVRRQEDSRTFTAMSVQDAVSWLLSGRSGQAGEAFRKFLQVHGHRCVREADMFERSWAQEPATVVSTIQAIAALPAAETGKNQQLSVEVLLSRLHTPLSFVGKAIIRRVLPKAWHSVGRREWSKSLQVKMNDRFKQCYWKLAAAMKREGRIPDEELLFFFTHKEIGTVLKTRSARLIARAQKRRKLYPQMVKLTFQRDHAGHPEPISTHVDFQSVIQITGMPVSLGTVRGRARVILDLESASTIKSGEILIVPFTDIGWSPYFPLISGLVTEIGGLISHGAVVAREYGIPCVVNCPGATEIFGTGDFIELSGDNGTVRKLKTDSSEQSTVA